MGGRSPSTPRSTIGACAGWLPAVQGLGAAEDLVQTALARAWLA
ncbi:MULTISPECIES: hypothetical protein [unclassified Nonomuraea]|nr:MULTISPECIES: hypothetical protein [unclassified Nonomuraea]